MWNNEVFVVRHAERIDYVDRNWLSKAGHTRSDDPHLAPKGEKMATELAARLANASITHIYSSPFIRCVQTANAVAEQLNVPILIEPGLCEVLWDFPPGFLPTSELKKRFPLIDDSYTPVMKPTELRAERADGDASRRAERTTATIVQKHITEGSRNGGRPWSLLLMGHGASCLGMVAALGGYGYQGLCTVSHFVREATSEKSKWAVKCIGDPSHLSDKSNLRAY